MKTDPPASAALVRGTPTPAPAPSAIEADVLKTLGPMGRAGKWRMAGLGAVFLLGVAAYIHQLRNGLAVTAMTDYFSWGVYIINFVFFIGISMAGSLISAILRLTGAGWRKPITRMAEGITVFALLAAAAMIIVDMGRPDRFFHVLRYGRVQSPILWDVFSLTTYLAGSVLFLYLPLIPDLAILRDRGERFAPWRRRLYAALALGWTGTPDQHHRLEKLITIMSVIIIPVAVSIHTVTSWIFGMTLRPGWHTTIIGPDFVVGALYSGIAAVITVMALLRRQFHLERYLTAEHFKKLSLLLLTLCVAYFYFVVNEYLGPGYTNETAEGTLLDALFTGNYAIQFWSMAAVGLVLPGLLLALPWTRTIKGIVTASILVNIGMWLKRYVIVVPTLSSPFMPVMSPGGKPFAYVPTWVEWAITAGGFAGFCLFYYLFAKLVPIVSIWETETATPGPAEANATARTQSPPNNSRRKSLTALTIVALSLGAFGFLARTAVASDAPAPQPSVALKVSTEEGKKVIVATVTLNGKPLEGAKVTILAQRTFGRLALGTEDTLDDGTAAVPFPADVPGDAQGRLQVVAEVKAGKDYAAARVPATLDGAPAVPPQTNPFSRALWAPRAPLPLVLTLLLLLGAVWGTYGYVVVQLLQLRKGTKPCENQPPVCSSACWPGD